MRIACTTYDGFSNEEFFVNAVRVSREVLPPRDFIPEHEAAKAEMERLKRRTKGIFVGVLGRLLPDVEEYALPLPAEEGKVIGYGYAYERRPGGTLRERLFCPRVVQLGGVCVTPEALGYDLTLHMGLALTQNFDIGRKIFRPNDVIPGLLSRSFEPHNTGLADPSQPMPTGVISLDPTIENLRYAIQGVLEKLPEQGDNA